MKSKKKFVLAGLVLLAVITMVLLPLTGCETEVEPVDPPAKYTVTFNTDGGSEVASQTVESGKTATKPEDPTKTSYDFAGWYSDKEGTTPYSFDTPVTKKITLHAKWTSKESGGENTDNGEEKPGSGENNTDSKPCNHQPRADEGDCTTEVKCRVCGEVTTPAGQHTPNNDDDDCTTPITCSVCETTTTPAKKNHTGGIATCTEKAKCTACGTAYGELAPDNHASTEFTYTENNDGTHKKLYACCGAVHTENEACSGGTATCVSGKICEYCKTAYGDVDAANHTSEGYTYVYTWAETTPTSIKNYTCLHCEKAIAEPISPSVWQVGDKVTCIAKDGNSYVSTVGEITDGKAVLVSDEMWSTGKITTSQEELLAIVEERVPSSTEAVWSNIIKPWLSSTLPASSGGTTNLTESIVYNSSGVFSRVVNYQGINIYTSWMSDHYNNKNTWVGHATFGTLNFQRLNKH